MKNCDHSPVGKIWKISGKQSWEKLRIKDGRKPKIKMKEQRVTTRF